MLANEKEKVKEEKEDARETKKNIINETKLEWEKIHFNHNIFKIMNDINLSGWSTLFQLDVWNWYLMYFGQFYRDSDTSKIFLKKFN